MGYIGLYGSVYVETRGKDNSNDIMIKWVLCPIVMAVTFEFFLMKVHFAEFNRILWNLTNHLSMNWDQFRCSLCCPCLCGALLELLTLKQEVVGSNTTFYKFLS